MENTDSNGSEPVHNKAVHRIPKFERINHPINKQCMFVQCITSSHLYCPNEREFVQQSMKRDRKDFDLSDTSDGEDWYIVLAIQSLLVLFRWKI